MKRAASLGTSIFCIAVSTAAYSSQEPPIQLPSLKKFASAVEALVHQYYPDAQVHTTDQAIEFEYKTREFMIHLPSKDGQWQDAHAMKGPDRGGILGVIEVRSGRYDGQWMGGVLDRAYFETTSLVPRASTYSAKCDCWLYASLDYPKDVNLAFLGALRNLVTSFEQYLE